MTPLFFRHEKKTNNHVIHVLLISIAGIIVYSNTLDVPFQFDDIAGIVHNPIVKHPGYLLHPAYFTTPLLFPVKNLFNNEYALSPHGRIAGFLTFAVNYRIHGLNVRGYHLTNLFIHLLNGVLFYFIIFMTLQGISPENSQKTLGNKTVSSIMALLFIVHPVQTQAVTYIIQRFTSLAVLFYLSSLACYMRFRIIQNKDAGKKRIWYISAIVAACLAMKSKEIAVTLPFIIILYEFSFLKASLRKRMSRLFPFLLTILIVPLSQLTVENIHNLDGVTRLKTGMSRIDYLFTQFRVIVTYIRLLFFPAGQNLDWDYPAFTSFMHPQVLWSFVFLCLLIILGIFLILSSMRSGSGSGYYRLIAFGIFWFFITLSVESSIFPITDIMFEHRMYLPSIGFIISVVSAILLLLNRRDFPARRVTLIVLSSLLIIVLGVLTYTRNNVWRTRISLWEDVVNKSPRKDRGHYNLASAYIEQGMFDKAESHLIKAIELKPDNSDAHNNLGNIYFSRDEINKALSQYEEAVKLDPNNYEAHYNLGLVYRKKQLFDKSQKQFDIARDIQQTNRKWLDVYNWNSPDVDSKRIP